jgi:Spy/CpxP family protein refolding chaperone
MMILKDDKHNRPGGYMKKTLLLIGALILVAGMVAYAGPGGYGRNCQANCEMGKGMGPGNGQGMGQGMGRGMGMRGHRGMERGDGIGRLMMMADELQLTDQQKEKIHTLMSSFRLEQIDRRAAMQKAQVKMADLRRNDKASEAEVMAGIDEMAKLRADMAKMQYRHQKAVHAVLTDKQQEQLKTMRMDRMHRNWDDDEDDEEDDMPTPPQAPRGPHGSGN